MTQREFRAGAAAAYEAELARWRKDKPQQRRDRAMQAMLRWMAENADNVECGQYEHGAWAGFTMVCEDLSADGGDDDAAG